jgi:AcrR family transcriptional regulator
MSARKHLDLQQVIQTAVALADEHGFEAVTLASVADKLGIRIPSLYNYVSGLPGLRREMTLWGVQQLNELVRRAAIGKAGEDAILSIAIAYRSFAHAHPGIYPTTLRAAPAEDTELVAVAQELLDVLLAVMQPYGFDSDDTLHAIRALRSVLHGFVDLEIAGGFGLALDRDESFRQLLQTLIEGFHSRRDKSDANA